MAPAPAEPNAPDDPELAPPLPVREQQAPPDASGDRFFDDGFVLVTRSRIVIGQQTFQLRNVASVELGSRPPNTTGFMVGGLVAFFFGVALGVGLWGVGEWQIALLTGAGGVGTAIALFITAGRLPREFFVALMTNAGQVRLLPSIDRRKLEPIVEAIGRAMESVASA